MKILCVTHSWGPDGASLMLRHAVRHWKQDLGWQVDAICTEADAVRFRSELVDCGAVPKQTVQIGVYDVALVNTLPNAHRIDALADKAPKLPIVLWAHEGVSLLRYSQDPVSLWVKRFARCRRVIFQTEWQRDIVFRSFTALMPADATAVIPNGVAPANASPHHRTPGPFRIVCAGSVYGRKRPLDLARAVQRLAAEMKIDCEFIGDLTHANSMGPGFAQMSQPPVPGVRWIGALPHAQTLEHIGRADLLCQPSEDESFALAPLEAAARHVPSLLSKLAPYPYIGWRDETNCLMHRVGDVEGIAAQIRRIASDARLRDRLADGALELAQQLPMQTFLDRFTDSVRSSAAG